MFVSMQVEKGTRSPDMVKLFQEKSPERKPPTRKVYNPGGAEGYEKGGEGPAGGHHEVGCVINEEERG